MHEYCFVSVSAHCVIYLDRRKLEVRITPYTDVTTSIIPYCAQLNSLEHEPMSHRGRPGEMEEYGGVNDARSHHKYVTGR